MGFSSYLYDKLALDYSHTTILAVISFAISGYAATIAVYRLYLSPLAGFPGPKLAALTQWYETYCEIVQNGGGQFTFQIHKWHEQYGIPIMAMENRV